MSEKPRLLLLTPWPGEWRRSEPNPVTRYAMRYLRERFEMHLVFPARNPRAFAPVEDGCFLHPVPGLPATERPGPWPHLWRFPSYAWRLYRAGRRLLQQKRFRLILGYSGFVALPVGALGRVSGVPAVLKLFGVVRFLEFRPTPRSILANLEHLLAYRVPVQRLLVVNDGTGGRTLARKYGILHRFVEIPQPRPENWHRVPDARQRLGLPEDLPILLLVSRLDHFKGLHLLPAVLERLREVPLLLLVVGTGPLERRLRRELGDRGLLSRVRFLGYVPHEELAPVYSAADLYLGLADLTTCTRPVVEALSLGVPVVAWDLLESRPCLGNSPGVVWVPPGRVDRFAEEVAALLKDPERRQHLGRRAEVHARRHFPTEREVALREVRILEEVAGLVPGSAAARPG